MEPSLTPSELIELFLDGEAGSDERRELFAALARDADLRVEFQDALQLRCDLAQEAERMAPSPALGASVFAAVAAIEQAIPRSAALPSAPATASMGGTPWNVVARRALGILAATAIAAETGYILLTNHARVDSQSVHAAVASASSSAGERREF